MELRAYARVLLRRWPVVLILPAIVVLIGVYQEIAREPSYSADARLSVVRVPDGDIPREYQYDEYYAYLSSEFALDDLVETVEGNVFARAVAGRLEADGLQIRYTRVQQMLSPDRQHRILTLTASSTDHNLALAVANAAAVELEENPLDYVGPNDGDETPAFIRVIDLPIQAMADTQQARLILLLGLVVAFGAGILLAFVVDYLDDRLYDVDTVVYETDLPHLATIPGDRS